MGLNPNSKFLDSKSSEYVQKINWFGLEFGLGVVDPNPTHDTNQNGFVGDDDTDQKVESLIGIFGRCSNIFLYEQSCIVVFPCRSIQEAKKVPKTTHINDIIGYF